jgi:hypothetical protein
MLLLFACVVAHEFGHIFTARGFSVSTPDVTLLPIGGVARLERIPEAPHEEFLVAIAGPLVNVSIALLLVIVAGARLNMGNLNALESTSASLTDQLAAVNIFIALFNMIPAFPMDGGRVLRALLAAKLGFVRATERRGFRTGVYWTVLQSASHLHSHLRLPRGGFRSAFGRAAGDVARRAGEHRDDDPVRHAHAGRARRRGGAELVAHEPERVSGSGRDRKADRAPGAQRYHSRTEGAGT